jgi:hypothetical protein
MLATCVRKFHAKKYVKLYIKTCVLIWHFYQNIYALHTHVKNRHHNHANYHNLNYPIFFTSILFNVNFIFGK